MSNVHSTFTRLFDNIGFKCKIICHFKISAIAGLEFLMGFIPIMKEGHASFSPGEPLTNGRP